MRQIRLVAAWEEQAPCGKKVATHMSEEADFGTERAGLGRFSSCTLVGREIEDAARGSGLERSRRRVNVRTDE